MICIAPMMGWTDRHQRYLVRQLSRHVPVYTEMLAPEAILRGDAERYLRYHPAEHPVVFQLGGHDPGSLAAASKRIAEAGYDEVNFNCGCPSHKGSSRRFGAHLMKEPQLVAECLAAMAESGLPVSIKCRTGIDHDDSYEHLTNFVQTVRCDKLIVHARKAWLKGLSTRANRQVPPLQYDLVHRLKRDFPEKTIIINGAITEWSQAREHLRHVDGVMVGRRAYNDPMWLATVDRDFYAETAPPPTSVEVLRRLIPYLEAELERGTPLRHVARHLHGVYQQGRGARVWRIRVAQVEADRKSAIPNFEALIDLLETLTAEDRPSFGCPDLPPLRDRLAG